MAENLALEALERHTRIKLDPLPPSMVGASDIAKHLVKLPKAKTSRELGCWGADLHAALILPYAENIGEKFKRMTQSMMQLKHPTDSDFELLCPRRRTSRNSPVVVKNFRNASQ